MLSTKKKAWKQEIKLPEIPQKTILSEKNNMKTKHINQPVYDIIKLNNKLG